MHCCDGGGRTIYNLAFSVTIIIPIMLFLAAIGDTLVLLVLFLELWVAAAHLCIVHALLHAHTIAFTRLCVYSS